MSRVVASNNLKAAAENEGQALLITKTKAAEAEGNAIKISAEAEKEAARLRGQGVALFREEVARGMTEAAEQMKRANLDTNVILFSIVDRSYQKFCRIWQRECDIPRRQQRRYEQDDDADSGYDDEKGKRQLIVNG